MITSATMECATSAGTATGISSIGDDCPDPFSLVMRMIVRRRRRRKSERVKEDARRAAARAAAAAAASFIEERPRRCSRATGVARGECVEAAEEGPSASAVWP